MSKENKKKKKKLSLCIGIAAGAAVDAYLRLISGDEGNLLVHTAVFLVSAVAAAGIVYGGFSLWKRLCSAD